LDGEKTGGVFDTHRELSAVMGKKKPFVLVKMCEKFEVATMDFTFAGNTIGYIPWPPGTALPQGVVDAVVKKLGPE
jgi:hypothetical protein